MPTELPASALYSHPSLGRLWKKVHLSCSPFLHRTELQRLHCLPSTRIRKHFGRQSYSLLALGCADGTKESLLLKRLPKPTSLLALDSNLTLARRAALRLPAFHKSARRGDLTSSLSLQFLFSQLSPHPTLITLFGVLPNLNPLPLLRSIRRLMKKDDLLLFSANLAPGQSSHTGALRILPQYDNRPTRNWLEAAILRYRPKLPKGHLEFGVFPDPKQKLSPESKPAGYPYAKFTPFFHPADPPLLRSKPGSDPPICENWNAISIPSAKRGSGLCNLVASRFILS